MQDKPCDVIPSDFTSKAWLSQQNAPRGGVQGTPSWNLKSCWGVDSKHLNPEGLSTLELLHSVELPTFTSNNLPQGMRQASSSSPENNWAVLAENNSTEE